MVGTEAPVMKELQAYKVALNAGGSMVWTCDDIKGKIETALRS